MNAMRGGDGFRTRRPDPGAQRPDRVRLAEAPPDPFEDLAAPPLRLAPLPARDAPVDGAAHLAADGRPAVPPIAVFSPDDPAPSAADGDSLAPQPVDPNDLPASGAHAAAARPEGAQGPARTEPGSAPLARGASTPAAGGMRQLAVAVALGLAAAAAIVLAALLFRPAPAATAPDAPSALGSGPLPATAGRNAAATAASEASVRLRVGPDLPAARRAALEAAVAASGYAAVDVVAGPEPVDRARVEYFHTDDRAAAEALSRSLAPLTAAPLDVVGLVGPAPTDPGRLEVWIAE
jgi:hypothetical protein